MKNPARKRASLARAVTALERALGAIARPFRGSSPGATLTEYLVVTGFVALFAILAFNRFGKTLHQAYRAEANHVQGKGVPGAADLLGVIGGLTDPDGFCDLVTGVCGGPNGCFAAGTPVSTEQGDRPIEAIAPGERVWARDPETGAVALRTVTKTFIRRQAAVITLDLQQGLLSAERLKVTSGHRFWVEGKGWVPAIELAATPLWSTDASVSATVLDATPEITTVYNLEVEGYHTYFVGHSRALVHNQTQEFNCQNPAPPGFLPPAGGTGGFPQAAIDKCKEEFRKANGPQQTNASVTRPADSETRLCVGKLTECANAADKEACEEKWKCIDKYVAEHPSSEIFTSVSVMQRVARQCSNPGETLKSCYKGDAQPVTVSRRRRADINRAARERLAAQARGDTQGMIKASERAGDAAAQAHGDKYEARGYTCTYSSGSRVFDGVCVGPGGDVVILEAKGGDSQLGDRWDAAGDQRVQQGSPEYVEAVLADLKAAGVKGDAQKAQMARDIERAIAADKLTYEQVNQKFDDTGNPVAPTTREFELDRSQCPP